MCELYFKSLSCKKTELWVLSWAWRPTHRPPSRTVPADPRLTGPGDLATFPCPPLHTGWAAHTTKGAAAGTRPPHSRGSAGHMSHAKRLRSGGTPPAGASEHQSPRGADSDLSSSSSRISSKLISANPNTMAAATPRGGWVPRPAREPDPGASHSTVADSGRTPSDAGRHPKREKFKMCVFLTACLSLKERHVVSPCLEHSP